MLVFRSVITTHKLGFALLRRRVTYVRPVGETVRVGFKPSYKWLLSPMGLQVEPAAATGAGSKFGALHTQATYLSIGETRVDRTTILCSFRTFNCAQCSGGLQRVRERHTPPGVGWASDARALGLLPAATG